jgi:putative tryptophan/tyrosine transport system substrate-binding protein
MRLTTVGIIVAFTLAILVTPPTSEAQPPPKIPRIGMLWFGSPVVGASPYLEAFRKGLRELGYMEGQNIIIESRHAAMRPALLPDSATNLVLSKVDVIVAAGDPAIHAARHATSTIPIVMVAGADPVGSGLVTSLARPGGNLTGLSAMSPELSGKRLQLLTEAIPRVSRVAVLWNPADPAKALDLRELQATGQALSIQLQLLEVRGPEDFETAFAAMTRERAEALITLGDPVTVSHRIRIVDLVAKSRVPAMYDLQEFVEAGGLMAYGPSLTDLFRRAAAYVDKILKGAKPDTLPVEQPMKFELIVNLRTAKDLGVTLPQSVLFLADRVIQ